MSSDPAVAAAARVKVAGARALGPTTGKVTGALLGVVAVLVVWSVVAATGVFPSQLFPSVPQVAHAGWGLLSSGDLLPDVGTSLLRAMTGFLVGAIAGFALAVATSATGTGRLLLQPVLRLLAPIPTIGLVPLAILWFGIGEASKDVVIALGVFVPVWINSHAGLASTPADFLQASRCIGAGRRQTLLRVVIPEAAPDVVAGLRVGNAMAFVLVVVAEMTGTTHGLGYRIYQAQLFSQADQLLFCLVVLGLLGALSDRLITRLTAPVTRWSEQER